MLRDGVLSNLIFNIQNLNIFELKNKLYIIRRSKTKADVIECLSSIVQEDIMKDSQHRVVKDCRQQLRAQLYQQRENIHFDPVLQATCATDIKQFCFNVEPGNSQVATNYLK